MIEKIDGKTKLCGVMGNPIAHTLSPLIHNTIAGRMGHNLVYVPFHVQENVSQAVKGAYALNVLGLNVTVPYKKEVMDSLESVDEGAARIDAVNTLVRTEHGYRGYNTDYLGLHRAIEDAKMSLRDRQVVILGAGGAAKAACYLCGEQQAKEVFVLNRTKERAQTLVEELHSYFPNTKMTALSVGEYQSLPEQNLMALQTTSVGMIPHDAEAVIEETDFYRRVSEAVDVVYNPCETKFMKLVREQGGLAVNGLKMLLYQAVTAYELWNHVEISQDLADEIYLLLQKEFEHS